MIDAVGNAGTDDAEFICNPAVIREPVGNPKTTLAMLFPCSLGFKKGRIYFPHGGDRTIKTIGKRLASKFVEQRLGVKKIEMAGATFHEKKDYILRFAPVMGNLRKGGVVRSTGKQGFIGKSR
jgi:hypothetical protein